MSEGGYFTIKDSLFDKTEKAAAEFGGNMIMMYSIQECVLFLEKAQREYDNAILIQDKKLASQKKIEIQTYQSSLVLTAHVLAADEGSTA